MAAGCCRVTIFPREKMGHPSHWPKASPSPHARLSPIRSLSPVAGTFQGARHWNPARAPLAVSSRVLQPLGLKQRMSEASRSHGFCDFMTSVTKTALCMSHQQIWNLKIHSTNLYHLSNP